MIMEAYIHEIFISIQGEGSLVGLPFVFVRFAECNLKCPYCDTKFSWDKREFCYFDDTKIINPVSEDSFVELISSLPFNYISFTGGEPLINSEFIENVIDKIDKKIFIETNGTLYEKLNSKLLKEVSFWSVDLKLPSIVKEDLFELHKRFIFKLKECSGFVNFKVIFSENSNENEFSTVFKIVNEFYKENKRVSLIFQPITKDSIIRVEQKQLNFIYYIMKEAEFEVRLIPQIHKILNLQ